MMPIPRPDHGTIYDWILDRLSDAVDPAIDARFDVVVQPQLDAQSAQLASDSAAVSATALSAQSIATSAANVAGSVNGQVVSANSTASSAFSTATSAFNQVSAVATSASAYTNTRGRVVIQPTEPAADYRATQNLWLDTAGDSGNTTDTRVTRTNFAYSSDSRVTTTTGTWSTTRTGDTVRSETTVAGNTTFSDALRVWPTRAQADSTSYVAVKPGDIVRIGYEYRSNTDRPRRVRVFADGRDAANVSTGTVFSGTNQGVGTSGTFESLSASFTVPAGTYSILPRLQSSVGTGVSPAGFIVGDWMEFRRLIVTVNAEIVPFFDGNTTDVAPLSFSWTGAENASTSTQSETFVLAVSAKRTWDGTRWVEHIDKKTVTALNTAASAVSGVAAANNAIATNSSSIAALTSSTNTVSATALTALSTASSAVSSIATFLPSTSTSVSSLVVPVRKGSSGQLLITTSTPASAGLSLVYFTRLQDSTGDGIATVENKIGTAAVSATLTGGTPKDTVTVTFSATFTTSFSLWYSR